MPKYQVLKDMPHPERGKRPLRAGDTVELTPRQARYLVLEGTLTTQALQGHAAPPAATPAPALPQSTAPATDDKAGRPRPRRQGVK